MLNEQQQLLFDLCQPFWRKKSDNRPKDRLRAKALCQQDMLVWLGKQSGVGYKQFQDMTDEDLNKIVNTKVISDLLK